MTRNLWHNITHVVPTWEMFREFMARDLNILVCYHKSELVILGKPLVDPGECLICLTNEQVRCNECFNGKIRYTGVCWFVSTDSVGHATLINQFRTLPMPKLFAGVGGPAVPRSRSTHHRCPWVPLTLPRCGGGVTPGSLVTIQEQEYPPAENNKRPI